jgi:hypothetical protein
MMNVLNILFSSKFSEKVKSLLKNAWYFAFLHGKYFGLESLWRHESIKENLCFAVGFFSYRIFSFQGPLTKIIHDLPKVTCSNL